MPVAEASGWILGAADEVFSSFDDLRTALRARYSTSDPQIAGSPD